MGEVTKQGFWWLPGRETHKVPGELRLSSNEFVLDLEGVLSDPVPPAPGSATGLFHVASEPVVLGRTSDRKRITLLDCEGLVPSIPTDTPSCTLRTTAALLGGHLEAGADQVFDAVRWHHDYLHDWIDGDTLTHDISMEEGTGRAARVQMSAERSVNARCKIGDATIEVVTSPAFSGNERRGEIEISSLWRVETEKGYSWREMFGQWVTPLRDLVSFATARPAAMGKVYLRVAETRDEWCELLLRLLDLDRADSHRTRLIPSDFLFTASSLPDGFDQGIACWLNLTSKYSAVISLLLGVDYAPFMFDDQRFLALAQAVEIVDGVRFGGTPTPKDQHRKRVEDAVQGINNRALADWARDILMKSNWYQLSDRLTRLVHELGDVGQEIVNGDTARFVARVVNTRNSHAHRRDRRGNVLDGESHYWHWQALAWLVRAHLLGELGFTPQQVTSLVRENRSFQQFKIRFKESSRM